VRNKDIARLAKQLRDNLPEAHDRPDAHSQINALAKALYGID